MPRPRPLSARLLHHPSTPCPAIEAIEVVFVPGPDGAAHIDYRLFGRPDAVCWPVPRPPARRDGLWRHTCCEAFLGPAGSATYREFNFSPSGEWAAYDFSAERVRGPDPACAAPGIEFERLADGARLRARLPAAALPWTGRLELGLSVVVEAADGTSSYWALRHPAPAPDFHHRASFALDLEATP